MRSVLVVSVTLMNSEGSCPSGKNAPSSFIWMKKPLAVLKLVRIGKPYFSPIWFTSPVQRPAFNKCRLSANAVSRTDAINTCNVVHYLGVGSSGDIQELTDVGAHGVALLGTHVQAPLHVGSVVINHRLDLLQNHLEPKADSYTAEAASGQYTTLNILHLALTGSVPVVVQGGTVSREQRRVAVLQCHLFKMCIQEELAIKPKELLLTTR